MSSLATLRRFKHLKMNKAALILIALTVLIGLSCGKRRAPSPPKERVQQRAVISGFQRGSEVILSWQMPARDAADTSLLNIDRIDVYRLAEPLTAPQAMSEEDFASRSLIIAGIPVKETDFGMKQMTYRDELRFAGQPVRLRYAVRFVNKFGQKAQFSNFFMMEPAARVATAPTSLTATLSQERVALTWTPPTANVDASTPPNILGYNIYRSASPTAAATKLNPQPVIDTQYADRTFQFETEYFYFVRALSLGTDGNPVESLESNIITLKPVDTFPPSPPSSITIAATPTSISLFFPANPEDDVVGYKIYRSTDPDLPPSQWEPMTVEPQEETTYRDDRVESGKRYHYYITAIDRFGNVSNPSDVVNEIVP